MGNAQNAAPIFANTVSDAMNVRLWMVIIALTSAAIA